MFKKTTIITGFVSGIMLMTSSFATPAKAAEFPIDAGLGIVDLLLGDTEPQFIQARKNDYRYRGYEYDNYDRLPIRRITRKLRRRGLYPVSEFRLRRGRVIVRAENNRGRLFRVVANARSGNIIKVTRIRGGRRWQPAPAPYWGGYRAPSFDDHWSERRPQYRNNRLKRKPVKRVRKNRRQIDKKVTNRPRKNARPYVDTPRPARSHEKRRRDIKPHRLETRHGGSPEHQLSEEYKIWKYGSGK